MLTKIATIFIGVLVDKLPALLSKLYDMIAQKVEQSKKKKESQKAINEYKEAKSKEDAKDKFSKLP